jgi:peptidyl-prolyl cis-trans isomerase B (cyclophilin B)
MDKKTIIIFSLIFILLLGGLIVIKKANKKEDGNYMTGKVNVLIKVKEYGDIKLELDADTAPITVTNFVNLVNEHFYDGLTFHRIMDNFMIQGGNGETAGKHANTIKGEFSSNGVENNISHVRGVISMARTSVKDSASSQFFITNADATFLDGNYAAFGHVTEGMDVVDKITSEIAPRALDNNGTISNVDQPVIETITVIE